MKKKINGKIEEIPAAELLEFGIKFVFGVRKNNGE